MESKALISLFFMAFSNWYSSPRPGYGRCCTHLESEFSLQHIRNVDEMTNFSRDRRPGFDRNRGFHRPQNLSMGRCRHSWLWGCLKMGDTPFWPCW
jgi:hypothetical protein